jgi:hypothetical protein
MDEGLCIVWSAGRGELRVLGESAAENGPVGGDEQRGWDRRRRRRLAAVHLCLRGSRLGRVPCKVTDSGASGY